MDRNFKQQKLPSNQAIQAFIESYFATQQALQALAARVRSAKDSLTKSGQSPHTKDTAAQLDTPSEQISLTLALLEPLQTKTENNEFVQESELQAIYTHLPSSLHALWETFIQQLDDFEFEAASKTLQSVINQLQSQ